MGTSLVDREVLWKPHPGFQTRALQVGAYEALFGGAAGPGKTDLLIMCGARYCQHEAARVLFLRTSYTDLQDVRDRMAVLYPPLGAIWEAEPKRWRWPCGATLELGYGSSLAEVSRYLGRQYTAVLFDELGMVEDETVWTLLSSRVRSTDSTVPLRMRASANPGGPGHSWLKERFVLPTERGTKPFHDSRITGFKGSRAYVPGTAKDNPSLPSSYWEGLASLPPALQAALRDGDWDAGLGLFFPELAGDGGDSLFVPPTDPMKIPMWWDFWGAYDWGFRHPACFVACARDGTGTIHVMDTIYLHRLDDPEQAATVAGLGRDNPAMRECLKRVYAGHDAFFKRQAHSTSPETVADVFGRAGVYLSKAALDRGAGSRALRRYLGTRKLVLWKTPGNHRLLQELRALIPDDSRPETPRKRDANADTGMGGDDGPDTLRYAVATPPFLVTEPELVGPQPDDRLAAVYEMSGPPLDSMNDQYPEGF